MDNQPPPPTYPVLTWRAGECTMGFGPRVWSDAVDVIPAGPEETHSSTERTLNLAGNFSVDSRTTRRMIMAEFPGITHVALTVSDLDRSIPWYRALFGTDPVLDEDTGPFRHVVWLVGSTLVGLHQFPDPVGSGPFNERRIGLDHLAFACSNRS